MSRDPFARARRNLTCRRFVQLLGASVLGTGVWTRFVEPWWLKISERTIPLGLDGGRLRLLQLTDFHAAPMPLDFLQRSIRTGVGLKPDLICVTGDFITHKYDDWDRYAAILAELAAAAPTFAVLGNHDGGRWARHNGYANTQLVREMLDRAHIRLLHNERMPFDHANGRITLAGLGDWWADEMHPEEALREHRRDADRATVLLSHNPDTKDLLINEPWDLMLSGHTHGGQLSLPFVGEPFAPIRDRRYVRDLHRLGDRWLYISSGVGALHTARFNCRPEVSLLTLV